MLLEATVEAKALFKAVYIWNEGVRRTYLEGGEAYYYWEDQSSVV
jgi:hypothetical protein